MMRRRPALLLALTIELVLAGWWRWPWTIAPIETAFDYGSGHVAVVSEYWNRSGALRHHFLPVMSTDPDLPEWPFRTEFSQEYASVPPLAFMLHYAATRLFPRVEPVELAKLLAQSLTCVSVLAAAALLAPVFDAWSIFVGLSFLISGVPFVLWFANGYFAVNVGLAAQLVLVAWCANVLARSLLVSDAVTAPGVPEAILGGVLAFIGAFADYMPVAANGVAFAGLLVMALHPRAARRSRWFGWQGAAAIAVGTSAGIATTVWLYARQMGFARYRRAIAQRVADRTGDAPFVVHFEVIRRQMLTAWPAALLVALGIMTAVVVVWAVASVVRRGSPALKQRAAVVLYALSVAAIPSLAFHYRAVSYVAIHWWFAGTWTIGFVVVLCAFADLIRARAPSLWGAAACAGLTAIVVAANFRFAAAQPVTDPSRSDAVHMYRAVGGGLPHDGLPLVVADVTAEWPGLFEDYPFATAYLRRPVLLRELTGAIRLPKLNDVYEGRPFQMGGEDVRDRLLRDGGDVYVLFDRDARTCSATDVPSAAWHGAMSIGVCRAPANVVVQNISSLLGPMRADYLCAGPPAPSALRMVSNRDRTVVIEWSQSGRHTSYTVEVGRAPGDAGALVAHLGRATSFTARQVLPGTYYVRVRGVNGCGTGAASNELTVVVE